MQIKNSRSKRPRLLPGLFAALLTVFLGCQSDDVLLLKTDSSEEDADNLLIVDCLLPGQIKKLGAGATFVTPRRPAKLTALDCRERGGEYVAYDQANSASALKVWLTTAQDGNPEAQTYVGEIYEKGFGLHPDYKLAAQWYQKAADQGHARAKLNLGFLYEKGMGVPQNIKLALNLYRQASGLDDTEIDFQSELDSGTAVASANEIQTLKAELESRQQDLASRDQQLQLAAESLAAEQQNLQSETIKLQEQQAALNQQQTKTTETETTLSQRERELASKEAALKQKSKELAKQKQALTALPPPTRIASIEPELVKTRTLVDVAGPSIQLIRPKLVSMRGVSVVSVRPGNKTREIVGRVNAPGGLQSFYVNGKDESIDPRGLFRVLFPINQERNPITIAAIDRYGKKTVLQFELIQSEAPQLKKTDMPDVDPATLSDDFGRFHALVIGNNDYHQFPQLATAVNDAKSIAEVLTKNYGFKTTTLVNANRFMILAALNRLSQRLTPKDNLLVYYAGHGELSADKQTGYWLPVDADKQNQRKWIPNSAITDILSALPAKRVLVIADSCYSGSLTRSSMANQNNDVDINERLTWLRAIAKSKARLALTSGGLQPVADEGSSSHSVFANALLDTLKQNQGVLEGLRLYSLLAGEVTLNASAMNVDQAPEYAPIRHAGHESGEFFFLRRDS